jgi:pseudaminic acid cytidylyltransferase
VKAIAVIPARGGSKRIPRKNIQVIDGIPMIGRAITTANDSGVFSKVIVSTDDEEIAEISLKYGALVPRLRNKDLSDDFATTMDVIADAITSSWIGDTQPEYVCCIYATSPLLEKHHLIEGFKKITQENVDYVFPAAPYPHPIDRAFKLDQNGGLEMLYPNYFLTRTQDLPLAFHDVGQFYWGKYEAWATKKPIFSSGSRVIAVEPNEFVDIDNFSDLEQVQQIIKKRILDKG